MDVPFATKKTAIRIESKTKIRTIMQTSNWIKSLFHTGKRLALPIMTHPGIELSGHTVREAVTDGAIHFEAIKALSIQFPDAAAATVIMDLSVEAEAFGAPLRFTEDDVPTVVGQLVSNGKEVESLSIPSLDTARIPQFLTACRMAAEGLGKPVLGGCIGPYSLAGRLFGMTEIMMAIYTEPATAERLLEKCAEFLLAYCHALKHTGIAGIVIAEPAAGLLSNEDCNTYSTRYVHRIVEAVQDEDFMVVLHNCGNMGNCTQAMIAANARAYHFGNRINLSVAAAEIPADRLIMGNLDPVCVFRDGTPSTVADAALRLLDSMDAYPNFIISTGCDTPPHVPFENIRAFYDAVAAYNAGRRPE